MNKEIQTINAFFSEYFGCDVATIPDCGVNVVVSKRREEREQGYGPVFVLWLLLTENGCAISVQERLFDRIVDYMEGRDAERIREESEQQELLKLACEALGGPGGISTASGPIYYCSTETLRPQNLHPCRAVRAEDVPALEEVGLYSNAMDRSIREGTCHASYCGETPAAIAGVNDIGHMADRIGDLAVEALERYRRSGLGKTAVSHVTARLLSQGKTPLYATFDGNIASSRTAQSVGYKPYGWQFRIQARP